MNWSLLNSFSFKEFVFFETFFCNWTQDILLKKDGNIYWQFSGSGLLKVQTPQSCSGQELRNKPIRQQFTKLKHLRMMMIDSVLQKGLRG